MTKEPLYVKGYLAGYWDGVRDSAVGCIAQWQENDIARLPVQAMGLSTRACNCLVHSGLTYVKDVVALNEDEIMRIRNLGPKTAPEIADWMVGHGILNSAWLKYYHA